MAANWISNWNDLSYFLSTSHPDDSYQVPSQLAFRFRRIKKRKIGLLVQEKERKIDFQDGRNGGHLGFPIRMILAIFDLQVIRMLPTKFQVNWPSGSGEQANNRFQDGCHGSQLGFPIGTILALFDLQVIPMLPIKFQVNWPCGSVEEAKKRFSRWPPGFQIGTILAIFDLQVTPMLPTKLRVNLPFVSGEEAKNRFSRWPPSWISDWNDFSYF